MDFEDDSQGQFGPVKRQKLSHSTDEAQISNTSEPWLDPSLHSVPRVSVDFHHSYRYEPAVTAAPSATPLQSQRDRPAANPSSETMSREDVMASEDEPEEELEAEFEANITRFRQTVADANADEEDGHEEDDVNESLSDDEEEEEMKKPTTGRGGIRHRGPRKPAEPTGAVKMRLGQITDYILKEDYLAAKSICFETIRINAETFEAWTLLALCFEELADPDRALMALMVAAHMRPRNVQGWINCAEFALEKTGENRVQYLPSAKFCYSAAIKNDMRCVKARRARADVSLEMGLPGQACSDLNYILRILPGDTSAAHRLAMLELDRGDDDAAVKAYQNCIEHLRSTNDTAAFDWTFASAYASIFETMGQFDRAIPELKSVARWLVGHGDDTFWDQYEDDDREWDLDDSRRLDENDNVKYAPIYGDLLPIELRAQLGRYRLRIGDHDEAMVSCHTASWL